MAHIAVFGVRTLGSVANAPLPNPKTVEALLDTTWRVAVAETGRTDSLDRKASTLATFSSLLTSLTATLGVRFVEQADAIWGLVIFWSGLALLAASVALAVFALLPVEYVSLGTAYLERFPSWSQILKPPEQVHGEVMRTLVEAVTRERRRNQGKAQVVRWAFVALLLGLVLISGEAAILASRDVFD